MRNRAERHLRAVKLAMDCAELGARVRTIHHLCGLPPRELQRLLFSDPYAIPRGRAPDSPEWYHSANLLFRTDASIFTATYRRARRGGFAAADALVGAYRHYMMVSQSPHRISFDRAFDLASHLDGVWVAKSPSFTVVACPSCTSEYLTALGAVPDAQDCPFCKLVRRYGTDPRLQASFPTHPLPDRTSIERGMLSLVWSIGQPADPENRPNLPSLRQDPPHE